MRNKKRGAQNKMSVASIQDPHFVGVSARDMARKLLKKEFRGPGDTIEAAAGRLQTKYGVDAEIVLQGWRREIQEMKASRWLSLFSAYFAAGLARLEAAYDENHQEVSETDPVIAGLASFVAGRSLASMEGEEEEVRR